MKIYSVSELTAEIKSHLEGGWSEVCVEGEISNLRPSQAGHLYFSLKDSQAQLRAVMFRGQTLALRFAPEEGLAVLAFGRLSVYEPRGEYQILIDRLEPKGIGPLQLAFEQLKKKLESRGWFAPERKKPLPFCPQRIGIVTSPQGAALRDMLQILLRRFPNLQLLLAPVNVQGQAAAPEIAQAIRDLNREDLDLLIIGRGGGSIEDLWAFNEEAVALAIFESRHPIISAVGHETDFTLADFVADLRAPTPSAAAELAVPVKADLLADLTQRRHRLRQSLLGNLAKDRLRLKACLVLLRDPRRRLEELSLHLDALSERLYHRAHHRLKGLRDIQQRLGAHLRSLNPYSVLERGYAIATLESGAILRDSLQTRPGEAVRLTLARGALTTKVVRI